MTDRKPEALNPEAEFFIRSLDDLESERTVGDISDGDFTQLNDLYTVKAARALRPGPQGLARSRLPRRRGGQRAQRSTRWTSQMLGYRTAQVARHGKLSIARHSTEDHR